MTPAAGGVGEPVRAFDYDTVRAGLDDLWRYAQREEWRVALTSATDRCERIALDLVK